jgi:hypothetical protein
MVLDRLDRQINNMFGGDIYFWGRYRDDIHCIADQQVLPKIKAGLNEFDKSLIFTFEEAKRGNLPFLDIEITLHDGVLNFKHFYKETQTNRTIGFDSNHPLYIKKAIVSGEARRCKTHCSLDEDWENEKKRIKKKYVLNGYPVGFVEDVLEQTKCVISGGGVSKQCATTENGNKLDKFDDFVTIPYFKGVFELVQRLLRKQNIRVVPAKIPNIMGLVGRNNDRGGREGGIKTTKNVVYSIPCLGCSGRCYVGQTSRYFGEREAEHQRCIKNMEVEKSALAKHHATTGHVPDFKKTQVVFREKNKCVRENLEAFVIAQHGNRSLNFTKGTKEMEQWEMFFSRLTDV